MSGDLRHTIEPPDSSRALALMQEYTAKLVDATEAFNRRISQLTSSCLVGVGFACGLATVGFYYYPESVRPDFIPINVLMLLLSVLLIFILVMLVYLRTSLRSSWYYRVQALARLLEKLVSSASQYREHTPARFSEKFEYDLRIIDAETALEFFQSSMRSPMARLLFGKWN